ncbi:uncharacterized protein BX663DRAFT_539624 [Cokeromyces recurvatus]|uniref:uncharacterized protein n=1 Tax=Cokeromyces recurvatus TaxID=90255 RepID=UPI0022206111|nr:uncharacterized protein BX663DRAFT_539624 [Cokeromyces recurvatus]KAI7908327.1 hypothetical protein BX663DRAFT_539624 [Cokeromyces recurvatus]
MTNILLNGGKKKLAKWGKKKAKFKPSLCVPLVVFGDGMKNLDTVRIKGQMSGATAILEREIQLRSRTTFRLVIVSINEFKTSEVCNFCKETSLKETKLPNDKYTKSTLDCENCCIL